MPLAKLAEQVAPQLMPTGVEVMVPPPLLETLSVYVEVPAGGAGGVLVLLMGTVVLTPPLLHAARPKAVHRTIRRMRVRSFGLAAVLFGMVET